MSICGQSSCNDDQTSTCNCVITFMHLITYTLVTTVTLVTELYHQEIVLTTKYFIPPSWFLPRLVLFIIILLMSAMIQISTCIGFVKYLYMNTRTCTPVLLLLLLLLLLLSFLVRVSLLLNKSQRT